MISLTQVNLHEDDIKKDLGSIITTMWYFLSMGKFATPNRLIFQAQNEDLDLKCCKEG